jgi:hypothetical protein
MWTLGLLAGLGILALILLFLVVGNQMKNRLDNLEGQQQAAAQDDRVAGMQEELATLRQQIADNGKLIAGNRQSLAAVLQQKPEQSDADMNALAQQAQTLKALAAAQEGLKTRISTLETQLATHSPLAASSAGAAVSAHSATSGTKPVSKPVVTATKKPKSASGLRHKSPQPAVVRASNVPFVLTGTERRGSSSLAAIAPKGYTSLSQIALIGEGESVAGWTLVHAGYGQATFRVRGRTVRVSTH